MFSESIGKIEKLSGVPCQPGELGENQAGDVAKLDVFHHPLSFRMIFDRLSADRFEMIDLFDFPLFRFGVIVGASFVVLRAFAMGLVFGGYPNPDVDGFGPWRDSNQFRLHSRGSGRTDHM